MLEVKARVASFGIRRSFSLRVLDAGMRRAFLCFRERTHLSECTPPRHESARENSKALVTACALSTLLARAFFEASGGLAKLLEVILALASSDRPKPLVHSH